MCLYPQFVYLYQDDDGHICSTMNLKKAARHGAWEQEVPCGSCPECQNERKRIKGIQAWCESKTWKNNCWITLTYDDEHMPEDYSLHWYEVQKFMYKLRRKFHGVEAVVYKGKTTMPIRSFGCGEYGDLAMVIPGAVCRLGRPHFHIILFNFNFSDRYLWTIRNGNGVYRSPVLEKLWTNGNSEIEDVAIGSCMYVAGYVDKKKHNRSRDLYHIYDEATGEILFEREPEQAHGSNRPGLGYFFLKKFKSDLVRDDYIMSEQRFKNKLPKYFDKKILEEDDDLSFLHEFNKVLRAERAKEKQEDDWLRKLQKEDYLYTLANRKKQMKGIKL